MTVARASPGTRNIISAGLHTLPEHVTLTVTAPIPKAKTSVKLVTVTLKYFKCDLFSPY